MTLQSNSMEEIRRFEVKKPSEELQDVQVGRKYDFLENFLVPWLNSVSSVFFFATWCGWMLRGGGVPSLRLDVGPA